MATHQLVDMQEWKGKKFMNMNTLEKVCMILLSATVDMHGNMEVISSHLIEHYR